MPQKRQQQAPPSDAERQQVAEEARALLEARYESYREEATELWDQHGSDGRLTVALYQKLEVLLFKPTPVAFVEVLEPVQGKPYKSTGLKSTQVQYDRMNDVLGAAHWRMLFHYTQQGTLCKAVGIVGNDLHWARLDDAGNLLPYTVVGEGEHAQVKVADVIAQREGYGGWKSKTLGDTFKSSETNATKRMLSRFGPGSDVYRGELEDDVIMALRGETPEEQHFDRSAVGNAARAPSQAPPQRQAAPQQTQAPEEQPQPPAPKQVSDEEAAPLLEAILAEEDVIEVDGEPVDLQELRNSANNLMLKLPEDARPGAAARLALIEPRKDDPVQLRDLITRAQNALGS